LKSIMFALALLATGAILSAQETSTPKYEVGLSYSWLHVNSANFDFQRTGNGGAGYFEYNLNRMVGLVADVGGYANTRTGIDDKALTYLFGPRFNWRHARLDPYVQFLFGGHMPGLVQLGIPAHKTVSLRRQEVVWTLGGHSTSQSNQFKSSTS
jgi:hypothetical protein